MKNTVRLVVAISFAVMQLCAMAATITVYNTSKDGMTPIQQLTNAVATAQSGDVIVLERGTYTFPDDVFMADNTRATTSPSYCKIRLNVTRPNITIRGEDDTSRKTWAQGSEPVIIDGNGGKAIQLQLNANEAARIENLTFINCNGGANGSGGAADSQYGNWCNGGAIGVGKMANPWQGGDNVVITNCVFRGNQACLGGAIGAKVNHLVQDCFFTNNVATLSDSGSCMYKGIAVGCDFIGNGSRCVGKYVYEVRDCRAVGNNTAGTDAVFNDSTILSNCVFESNTCARYLFYSKDRDTSILDCEFSCNNAPWVLQYENTANNKTNNCRLSGCTFKYNTGSILSMYGSSSNPLNGSLTVTNCHFIENTATSTSSAMDSTMSGVRVLVAGNPGHMQGCVIFDSTFTNNYCDTAGLCNVHGARIVGCVFSADSSAPMAGFTPLWYTHYDAAASSVLEECDISAGELINCALDRCTIHDVSANVHSLFKSYARATNTLVKNCTAANLYYPFGNRHFDAEFVNCTFVSNEMKTCNIDSDKYITTNGCSFINCLFNGNGKNGTASDLIVASGISSGTYFWNNFFYFTNTYYGAFATYPTQGIVTPQLLESKKGEDLLAVCADPKFVKDSRPDAPYWSLLSKSPLVGKGDASIWTAEDVDLAGNLRLKDGKVDIGCYQCWLREPGMMIIFR